MLLLLNADCDAVPVPSGWLRLRLPPSPELSLVDGRRVAGGRPAGLGTPKLQVTLAAAQRSHFAEVLDGSRTQRNFCARHWSHAARLPGAGEVELGALIVKG